MAFIPKKSDVGRTVRLTKPINTGAGTYTVGHEFKIVGESNRGHDLQDKDGNNIIECGMHRGHYEFTEVLDEQLKLQARILGVGGDE